MAQALRRIERATGRFESAAVESIVSHRKEALPELLRILEDAVDRAAQLDTEGDYMAHLYAMHLLAQFQEAQAYPLVVRFALLPGDLLDSLCGDFLTGGLGNVLASVCGGELGGIQSVIENEEADEWARSAGLSSLVTLVATGRKSRDEIASYLGSLFRGKLVRKWSQVWDGLVDYSSHLYPGELMEEIKRAYLEELVDPGYIGLDEIEGLLALGKEQVLSSLAIDPHHRLVEDVAEEMSWWGCFQETERAAGKAVLTPVPAAMGSKPPKTGRNDPCPCGSGKKYKKCCLTQPTRESDMLARGTLSAPSAE